jgi:hypothetical protein
MTHPQKAIHHRSKRRKRRFGMGILNRSFYPAYISLSAKNRAPAPDEGLFWGDEFLEFGGLAQTGEALVFAGFGQQVWFSWVSLQPFGAQGQSLSQSGNYLVVFAHVSS